MAITGVEGEVRAEMGIRRGRAIWGWGWVGRGLVRGMILVRQVGVWICLKGSFLGGRGIFSVSRRGQRAGFGGRGM